MPSRIPMTWCQQGRTEPREPIAISVVQHCHWHTNLPKMNFPTTAHSVMQALATISHEAAQYQRQWPHHSVYVSNVHGSMPSLPWKWAKWEFLTHLLLVELSEIAGAPLVSCLGCICGSRTVYTTRNISFTVSLYDPLRVHNIQKYNSFCKICVVSDCTPSTWPSQNCVRPRTIAAFCRSRNVCGSEHAQIPWWSWHARSQVYENVCRRTIQLHMWGRSEAIVFDDRCPQTCFSWLSAYICTTLVLSGSEVLHWRATNVSIVMQSK